ncbi:peptidoglycan-binding domain-containing protein [Roseibium sp. Sym1]|uniref:peptidoglycan-binding domain-containing protein n=1 Tax=Roseibium sp. Sym1 TaxID=3016006 RepID=UPI0022B4AE25|nr:peptidoglycan-binding domain-containing protein [Roseibium sp. Sym1]
MRALPVILAAFFLGLVTSIPARAEFSDWKALYQKSIEAAQNGDFETAIKGLDRVQEETGPNPAVVFNLALANAKAGNLIKSAMLFRLYLVMMPEAPNAQAVRDEIARVDQEIAKGETELFRRALAAAAEFPDMPEDPQSFQDPKKVSLFKSIEWRAREVGNKIIVEEARKRAREAADAVGYDYSPSERDHLFRDNLDDVGDIIAIIEDHERYEDPKDFWKSLQAGVIDLGHYFPHIAGTWLPAVPAATFADDEYRRNDLVRLALSAGRNDPFAREQRWHKNIVYLTENDLRDKVLDGRPQSEWKALAEEILAHDPGSPEAWAALSSSKKALKHILETGGNPFNPLGQWYDTLTVARMSLMVGNFDGIRRSRNQVVKLSGKENDFAGMTDLLHHTAKGNIGAALSQIAKRDHDWGDGWQNSIDIQFARTAKTAAVFLIEKGAFEDARKMLAEGVLAREVPPLLARIADKLEAEGKTGEADALRTDAEDLAAEIRGNWKPASDKHLKAVQRWQTAGKNYGFASDNVGSIERNVASALDTEHCYSDTKAECIINSLYFSAKAWGDARMTIRSLEKIDPETAVWLDPQQRLALKHKREAAWRAAQSLAADYKAQNRKTAPGQSRQEAEEAERLMELAGSQPAGDRAGRLKTYTRAADLKSTAAIIALIDLYDPAQDDLSEWEVMDHVADGLERGDEVVYERVISGFRTWPEPLRKELQSLLHDASYYDGTIDGIMGPNTRRAIDEYFGKS